MFGCCKQAMGIEYFDKDNQLDPDYLKANYPEGSKYMLVQDSTTRWGKDMFRVRGEFPMVGKVVDPNGECHEICLCPCHNRDGIAIMC